MFTLFFLTGSRFKLCDPGLVTYPLWACCRRFPLRCVTLGLSTPSEPLVVASSVKWRMIDVAHLQRTSCKSLERELLSREPPWSHSSSNGFYIGQCSSKHITSLSHGNNPKRQLVSTPLRRWEIWRPRMLSSPKLAHLQRTGAGPWTFWLQNQYF